MASWILVLLAVSGCASVDAFDATPRNVCRGDAVQVSWKASGSVSLESTPPLPGIGSQPSEGTRSFAIEAPTLFELHARHLFKDDHAEREIDFMPRKHGFGAQARCSDDGRALLATVPLTTQIGPGFRVAKVRNLLQRQVDVGKDGRVARLEVYGQESEALQGLPAQGDWSLSAPLAADEDCDGALRSIRQRLRAEIHFECGP